MPRNNPRHVQHRELLGDHGRRGRRDDMRRQVAYLAARLIAEGGAGDLASARAKAARQAGLADSKGLPELHEIEAELRAYQQLFQAGSQPEQLRVLRRAALEVMRAMTEFSPVLTGPVLTGTANEFSPIELQLTADDLKLVEMFLINRKITYRSTFRHLRRGAHTFEIPELTVDYHGTSVEITVFTEVQHRMMPKNLEGVSERAGIHEVEALLAG